MPAFTPKGSQEFKDLTLGDRFLGDRSTSQEKSGGAYS